MLQKFGAYWCEYGEILQIKLCLKKDCSVTFQQSFKKVINSGAHVCCFHVMCPHLLQ